MYCYKLVLYLWKIGIAVFLVAIHGVLIPQVGLTVSVPVTLTLNVLRT